MSSSSTDYTLNPAQLAQVLEAMILAREPVMVWGPPGVGKSQVAMQVAKKLKYQYIDVRALLLDPVDLRGIPWRDGSGRTRWAPPAFLPPQRNGGKYLINLEEVTAAPPMVQAALYQLVLDRACGEYRLPENASVIACGNRISDRSVAHRMPKALSSRFAAHIEVAVEVPTWSDWATRQDLAAEVIFFVQCRPELLHDFRPESAENAFPCPRTWEKCSTIIKNMGEKLDSDVLRSVLVGCVGEGAAIEFCAFMDTWHQLPHPQSIVDNPQEAEIPENISALIATCGSLYRLASEKTFEGIVIYAQRLRPEIGQFLVGAAIKKDPSLQHTKAYVKHVVSNDS